MPVLSWFRMNQEVLVPDADSYKPISWNFFISDSLNWQFLYYDLENCMANFNFLSKLHILCFLFSFS